jgi:hypothetical protein
MRRTLLLCGVLAALVPLGACGGEKPVPPPPFKPLADNKLLMQAIVDPVADRLWAAVSTDITVTGHQETKPQTDQEWLLLRNDAVTLAESGNLLMMHPRAHADGDWMRLSQDLIDTAAGAISAIDAKNPERLFDAGGEIYAVCTGCHSKYHPMIVGKERD